MNAAYLHLWAAGYDLPPEPYFKGGEPRLEAVTEGFGTFEPALPPRRGKAAAKAKRTQRKAQK